jgi:4-amino-4-deoxy-L-arabinose transferase-like glycosyltransferase
MKSYKQTAIDIAVLSIAALILRLAALGSESFWIDEIATLERVSMGWHRMMDAVAALRYHGPLQYILAKLSCEAFGYGEFGARLPSAILGAAAVPFFYLTARRLAGRSCALIASALLACSTYHIAFSQEARFYGIMGFFTCASMYFFVRLIHEKSLFAAIGYAIATSLMLYNHYYGIFVILAQNITLLCDRRFLRCSQDIVRWLLVQTATALLFAPWLFIVLEGLGKYGSDYKVLEAPGIMHLLATPWYYADKQMLMTSITAILILLFAVKAVRNRSLLSENKVAVIWFVVPVIVPFAVSVLLTPIYSGRYILAGSFGMFIIIAVAVNPLKGHMKKAALALLACALLFGLYDYYRFPDNEQWKEVAAYLDKNEAEGDVVILHPAFNRRAYNYYARSDDAKGFPLFGQKLEERGPEVSAENAPLIDEQTAGAERVWLVLCHSYDKDNLIAEHLGKSYRQAERKQFHKIELLLFDSPN